MSPKYDRIVCPEEDKWYKENNCTHAHCPFRDEHPQPFIYKGVLVCGQCFHKRNTIVWMVPCDPETCED